MRGRVGEGETNKRRKEEGRGREREGGRLGEREGGRREKEEEGRESLPHLTYGFLLLRRVLEEILQTEEAYVADLKLIEVLHTF